MSPELSYFISISHRLGNNPFWIQGPGGNTSVKLTDGTMIVKSSGSELNQVSDSLGYALCRPSEVNARLNEIALLAEEISREAAYSQLVENANLYPEKYKRPSMELGLHTLLAYKFVLHFHSPCGLIAAHLHANGRLGAGLEPQQFGFQTRWLDFRLPGYALAAELKNESAALERNRPTLIILKNHGVILATDQHPEALLMQYEKWESALCLAVEFPLPYGVLSDRGKLHAFAQSHATDKQPLYPDSIILEERIARVVEQRDQDLWSLNPAAAAHDTGAADIFAVESLIKTVLPDIDSIPVPTQDKIRHMPAEIARKKLMHGAQKP